MRVPALLLLVAAAIADELPYPPGKSVVTIEGAETALLVPAKPDRGLSLVLLLHGAGDNGPNLVLALGPWADEGYVVCAPSATDGTWDTNDLAAAKRIALHLLKTMPIDPRRVHAVGFSNGGWNLAPIAFDDDLKPASATWIAAGFNGGAVGKWARKGLGALALAGAQDPNAPAAVKTVDLLRDKVRSVEVRLQKGLDHKWPKEHDAYLLWWMGAMEGRFVPGKDLNFAWGDDLDAALAGLKPGKKGGVILYVWGPDDAAKPEAKELQNEVLMDPLVRHYGNQLAAVKLEMGDDVATKLGVTVSPSVAVLDRAGAVKKLLAGKVTAKALAAALRSVAPDSRPPKD
jgi:dienelactone hydrolase